MLRAGSLCPYFSGEGHLEASLYKQLIKSIYKQLKKQKL